MCDFAQYINPGAAELFASISPSFKAVIANTISCSKCCKCYNFFCEK